MTGNSFDSGTPAFDVVLAQTIARHFRGATTETIDDTQTVRLGEGLPIIECIVDEVQDHEPFGAFVFLQISGGAFGSRRSRPAATAPVSWSRLSPPAATGPAASALSC